MSTHSRQNTISALAFEKSTAAMAFMTSIRWFLISGFCLSYSQKEAVPVQKEI